MAQSTLFSQVANLVTIDVDSMNPHDAVKHTSPSFSFCDMTSNQAIVQGQMASPDRADVMQAAIDIVKAKSAGKGVELEAMVDDVLDVIVSVLFLSLTHMKRELMDSQTVLLGKAVAPNLKGRMHAQAAPSTAYSTENTIAHAKKLVAIFESQGYSKDRVCIKIPATPESIIACQYLEKIGIRTLATCLFSIEQAVAASQAGCLYVAPYFNELAVHFVPSLWKEYADTAGEHPMGPVIQDIVHVFRASKSTTKVMPASIVTSAEVIFHISLHAFALI